ncbi:hypothetical protein BsIDN1_03060 [Bacillus safensis]|uniref:Uncharacterized protein n=1 Tax=Bacillus safensis TaxID=561879 RepID=A0A5S9M1Y4_BACIA|nr:hypothetical protein BsIDN1_03060 [Bacillus safensis]
MFPFFFVLGKFKDMLRFLPVDKRNTLSKNLLHYFLEENETFWKEVRIHKKTGEGRG